VVVDGAHIGVTAHVTPTELCTKLDFVEIANGFANRFLHLWTSPWQLMPKPGVIPTELLDHFGHELRPTVAHIWGATLGNSDLDKLDDALVDVGNQGLSRSDISALYSGNRTKQQLDALADDLVAPGVRQGAVPTASPATSPSQTAWSPAGGHPSPRPGLAHRALVDDCGRQQVRACLLMSRAVVTSPLAQYEAELRRLRALSFDKLLEAKITPPSPTSAASPITRGIRRNPTLERGTGSRGSGYRTCTTPPPATSRSPRL
jgi:hypothetical protein